MRYILTEQVQVKMETNLGGKLSFSVELGNGSAVDVKIVKC